MNFPAPKVFLFILVYFLSSSSSYSYAQSILSRKISLHIIDQPLGKVMTLLEQKGSFGFAYSSKTVPLDSVISLQAENITVKEALDILFNEQFEYQETKNFIILRYAPLKLSMLIEKAWGDKESYTISGYITAEDGKKKLHLASVYEKYLAKGTLTDENGHFELEFHNIDQPIVLTASKENYKDATSFFLREVNVQQKRKNTTSDYSVEDFDDISGAGLIKFLVSTKQQIQSLNLPGVISRAPYQASLIPAINTHGTFSGQIVNQVSLNLIGGYNAGVNGLETGGIFNINKMNIKGMQIAGLFNIAGGSVKGVQLSGLYNNISHNADGVQLTGINNSIGGNRNGLQIAGLFNKIQKNSSGLQIAGLFNIVHGRVKGVQIAGIYNRADTLNGIQFGLINVAGSSTGYSFGLINFIGNGFNKVSFGYNETIDLNIALKTGTNMLYTIWHAGMNLKKDNRLYAFGLGLGTTVKASKWLNINPELSCRYLYQGSWRNTNLLNRFDLNFNFKLNRTLTIGTGPSANIYYSDQESQVKNYVYVQNRPGSFDFNNSKVKGWIGWGAVLTVFQ